MYKRQIDNIVNIILLIRISIGINSWLTIALSLLSVINKLCTFVFFSSIYNLKINTIYILSVLYFELVNALIYLTIYLYLGMNGFEFKHYICRYLKHEYYVDNNIENINKV